MAGGQRTPLHWGPIETAFEPVPVPAASTSTTTAATTTTTAVSEVPNASIR